jgi:hypothetical protein
MTPKEQQAATTGDMQQIRELVQQITRAALDGDWRNVGRLQAMIEMITEKYTRRK